jgi:hypothetical protein
MTGEEERRFISLRSGDGHRHGHSSRTHRRLGAGPARVGGDLRPAACLLCGRRSVRGLCAHVPGRVRQLVLLPEHADARRPPDPDRAVHRAAGATRPDHHRQRGRAGAGRRRGGRGRRRRRGLRAPRRQPRHGGGGDGRGRRLDRAGRRPAPVSRRQRDDLQPAAHLHRHRPDESFRRGPAARSVESQQAVDPADRRRQHAGHDRRQRRALGSRLRHRRLPSLLHRAALHDLRLRHAGDRGQSEDRAHDGPQCRPLRAGRMRCRRRGGGPRRHGRGGGGARQGQRLAGRRLRLHRHSRLLPGATSSAGDHPGRHPAGWYRCQRRPASAPARPAGRGGGRAAGHHLRLHPGERDAVRPLLGLLWRFRAAEGR